MNDDWKTWKFAGIYGIRHGSDGKIYVGQSQNIAQRISCHKATHTKDTHLYRAINCYGWDTFDVVVLEKVDEIDLLNERERHWMDHFESYNPESGYNILRTVEAEINRKTGEKQLPGEQFRTMKIWSETWNFARQIAAITGESLVALLDRLANAELTRVQEAQRYEAEYRAQTPGQE
jgi:group I intron endonuclease